MSSQKNKGSHAEKNKMVTGTIMTLAGGILWGVSGVCGQYMFQNKGVTAPWLVSVRLVAAGLLMLAIGLCAAGLLVLVCGKFLPWFAKGIAKLWQSLFKKKGGACA